jgi:peroxiredoxin
MGTLKRLAFASFVGFLILSPFSKASLANSDPTPAGSSEWSGSQEPPKAAGAEIHVVLHRVDNVKPSVFSGFSFDKESVDEAIKKYPVKLPDPLPAGAELGYATGPTYALLNKLPGEGKIKLTVDANGNFDLTDDPALELASTESIEKGTVVKIARSFGGASPHTEWLPYLIAYRQYKDRNGELRDSVIFASYYNFEGNFRLGNREYTLRLDDGDARGRFIKEKLVNVYLIIRDKAGETPGKSHRFFELIPIEDALYEVKAFAEDGSWMDLVKSSLPTTALGKPAPDMILTDTAGTTFQISDYRGKLLVLDFWYVWCKPCLAKFPDIKKTIDGLKDRPFAAIGINIDEAVRLEQAKKIIADYQLTWRQVAEGKGEFIPVYQVYGRMAEHPMSFPIYVAIDGRGLIRYSTNDFKKMERFLDAYFNDPQGPDNTLFVPCAWKYGPAPHGRPTIKVDFTGPQVQALVKSGKLKLPEALPKDARIGMLPNGTDLIAYAGSLPGKIHLVVDENRDFDLTKGKEYDIPILAEANPEESQMVSVSLQVPFESGGRSFLGMPSYARQGTAGVPPDVHGLGIISRSEGTFFSGQTQYALEIDDPNGDRLFTEDDTSAPGFLRLSVKKGDTWTFVYEGTRRIPIGGSLYRLKFVSDDGDLVELEREKQ